MNYLIVGVSYRLIDNEINKVIFNRQYKSYNMSDTSLEEVLIDASYSSLFDDEKVIVIKNFEELFNKEKDLELLNTYLDEKNNTILILVSSSTLSTKSKVNKEILSKLKVIETKSPTKPYEVTAFVIEKSKEYGFRINEDIASKFAVKCAYNLDVIIMEMDKLKLIKGKDIIISLNDVIELVPNYNADDSFELKDAIVNKDIKRAEELINEAESAKLELIPIVVMLAKEYELLYSISSLVRCKKTNEEIGKLLGNMHPYRVKMLRNSASKYTEEKLKELLLYLCNLNLKCVSDDNLGLLELKKFLLEL